MSDAVLATTESRSQRNRECSDGETRREHNETQPIYHSRHALASCHLINRVPHCVLVHFSLKRSDDVVDELIGRDGYRRAARSVDKVDESTTSSTTIVCSRFVDEQLVVVDIGQLQR